MCWPTSEAAASPFQEEKALDSKDGMLLAWEAYLEELSRQKPVLIVLDDLQCADSSTVRLLEFLLRSGDQDGPRFLCTLSKDEVHIDEDGRSNINDLILNASLDGLCRTVELGGRRASEATFSALLSGAGGTGVLDGELVCLVIRSGGESYAVLLQVGVPQGTLGSVTSDVDAMAGSLEVRP